MPLSLGSPAVIGFVTGAIGAAFGAWLTSRAAHKRRIVEELKAMRAAYALAQTITNTALAIKGQHIKPMKDRFDRAQIEFIIASWNSYVTSSLCQQFLRMERDRAFGIKKD